MSITLVSKNVRSIPYNSFIKKQSKKINELFLHIRRNSIDVFFKLKDKNFKMIAGIPLNNIQLVNYCVEIVK